MQEIGLNHIVFQHVEILRRCPLFLAGIETHVVVHIHIRDGLAVNGKIDTARLDPIARTPKS